MIRLRIRSWEISRCIVWMLFVFNISSALEISKVVDIMAFWRFDLAFASWRLFIWCLALNLAYADRQIE